MSISSLKDLIPEKYAARNKKYIEDKLDNLQMKWNNIAILSGNTEVDPLMFKENRERLVNVLKDRFPKAMVLLKGGVENVSLSSLGRCYEQDTTFYWTFGVMDPYYWGAIDVNTGTSYLLYDAFVDYEKIVSSCKDPELMAKKHLIDKVMSCLEMKLEIVSLNPNVLLVPQHMDEAAFDKMHQDGIYRLLANCGPWLCSTVLSQVLADCRKVKSKKEEAIMRIASNLNSESILFVLKGLKKEMSGYGAAAMFELYVRSCLPQATEARPVLCLKGPNAMCLKPELCQFRMADTLTYGDLCMLDMGVAVQGYRTNIIATVPVGGKFSQKQALLYSIVLKMRNTILKNLKPGIVFSILEKCAYSKMIKYFLIHGWMDGKRKQILNSGLCQVFCPNGIGHFMGLDFYDGEVNPNNGNELRNSFCYKQTMVPGMIIALNTEIYVNEKAIMDRTHGSGGYFIQVDALSKYFGLVVRIQDIILITEDSNEILSILPRSIKEIEAIYTEKEEIVFSVRDKYKIPKNPELKWIVQNLKQNAKLKRQIKNSGEKDGKYFTPVESGIRLRYACETKTRVDLDKLLTGLLTTREPQPIHEHNDTEDLVYGYPCKLHNMLAKILIAVTPSRRRPKLVPYPRKSFLSTANEIYPPQGFGCPYFRWVENIENCEERENLCIKEEKTNKNSLTGSV